MFTRRTLLAAMALVLALGISWGVYELRDPWRWRTERPHIVLLSIDTLRRDHLTLYGYEKRDTSPNLKALAEHGIVFDAAIAVHTNTGPAHASMMTGLYPLRHGLTANGMSLARRHETLAETLEQQGYTTGAFVSGWTLSKQTELHQGFDTYDECRRGDSRRDGSETWQRARTWLDEALSKPQPTFLFLHLFEPHAPYEPPQEFVDKFARGISGEPPADARVPGLAAKSRLSRRQREEFVVRYDAEIAYADSIAGELIDYLRDKGVYDDTLLVFTADHGETLWEREWVLDHGGRAYDEQLRIPCVVRLPHDAYAGTRVSSSVSQIDYLPTLLDYLDLPAPEGLDGRSLSGWIRGSERPAARTLFAHGRVAPGRVPEITAPLKRHALITVVRDPPHKLLLYPQPNGDDFAQLFDLQRDPNERVNRAPHEPALVKTLTQRIPFQRDRDRTADHVFSEDVKSNLKALGYME